MNTEINTNGKPRNKPPHTYLYLIYEQNLKLYSRENRVSSTNSIWKTLQTIKLDAFMFELHINKFKEV